MENINEYDKRNPASIEAYARKLIGKTFRQVCDEDDGTFVINTKTGVDIPYEDLETDVRQVWEKTVQVLKDGLQIQVINGINYNNFPKASENKVCHVRPHGQNASDTDELPDGRYYPKQCFWLNNTYILSQINNELR